MPSFNQCTFMGRLTKDPEAQLTQSNIAFTVFRIAVDRYQSASARANGIPKETDFFRCVAWQQRAEFVANYCLKGDLVLVTGRMQNREWTDNDNVRHTITELIVDNVQPISKPQGRDDGGGDDYDGPGYEQAPQGRGNGGGGGGRPTYDDRRDSRPRQNMREAGQEATRQREDFRDRGNGGGHPQNPPPRRLSPGNGGGRTAPARQQPSFDDDDMGDPFAE